MLLNMGRQIHGSSTRAAAFAAARDRLHLFLDRNIYRGIYYV